MWAPPCGHCHNFFVQKTGSPLLSPNWHCLQYILLWNQQQFSNEKPGLPVLKYSTKTFCSWNSYCDKIVMCKASCTYISYNIRCLFTMFLLNVQPIGFWVEESFHLSPSCVHDYGILHWTFEPLAMFFWSRILPYPSCLLYIYLLMGQTVQPQVPTLFICLESFSHEKRISNSFNRRFCLSVRMQPATSATPFLLFFAGLYVRWHHFCEYLASTNFISFLVLFSCYLIYSLMVFVNLGCTCLLSWQPVKQLYWQRTHVIEATSGCWPLQIFPHITCSNTWLVCFHWKRPFWFLLFTLEVWVSNLKTKTIEAFDLKE